MVADSCHSSWQNIKLLYNQKMVFYFKIFNFLGFFDQNFLKKRK